jgi:hypothetical protein
MKLRWPPTIGPLKARFSPWRIQITPMAIRASPSKLEKMRITRSNAFDMPRDLRVRQAYACSALIS